MTRVRELGRCALRPCCNQLRKYVSTPGARNRPRGEQPPNAEATRIKERTMTDLFDNNYTEADKKEDVKILHSMGYAQELERRMSVFSNFAVSFSIICILSGGINSLAQATAGAGGASIGLGWPLGCLISVSLRWGWARSRHPIRPPAGSIIGAPFSETVSGDG